MQLSVLIALFIAFQIVHAVVLPETTVGLLKAIASRPDQLSSNRPADLASEFLRMRWVIQQLNEPVAKWQEKQRQKSKPDPNKLLSEAVLAELKGLAALPDGVSSEFTNEDSVLAQPSMTAEVLANQIRRQYMLLSALNDPVHVWQDRARKRAEKKQQQQQQQQQNNQPAQISSSTTIATPAKASEPADCGSFLDCNACFNAGCAWCLGERVCVPDDVWMCQGQEDQVGKRVGQHKQCPDPLEAERRTQRRRQEAEREEAEQAQLEAAFAEAKSAGLSDSQLASLTSKKLGCVSWRQTGGCSPDGPREPQFDSACDQPIPSGHSGYCECSDGVQAAPSKCEHDAFTCTERCSSYIGARLAAIAKAKDDLRTKAEAEKQRLRAQLGGGAGKTRSASSSCSAPSSPSLDASAPSSCQDAHDDDEFASSPDAALDSSPSEEDETTREAREARWADIRARAEQSRAGNGGLSRPYEVLGVERSATQLQIRRAYHKLSLELHPDKNPEVGSDAETAFADLVAAYEILGNPDKRTAFESTGSRQQGFWTQEEWERSGQNDNRGFYAGNPHITSLTEKIWDRRVHGDQIWLVEFYAPWCSACINFAPTFQALAESMRDDDIAIGAVNCAVESYMCQHMFNIRAYPTIRMVSKRHGTQQEFLDHANKNVESISTWARQVGDEWRWLFSRANLTIIPNRAEFQTQVLEDDAFWLVLFSDGAECSSCKTAKTNMMRLSAGLLGMARVGFFDCLGGDGVNRLYCSEIGLPASPFSPQVRAYQAGAKSPENPGEVMYSPNEIEPHFALQLIEKTLRLSQTAEQRSRALAQGREAGWDDGKKDKKDEDDQKQPPRRPPPMWNGPKGRATLSGGQTSHHMIGGGNQNFMLHM